MKNPEIPKKLLWLDLEMTGLRPRSDRILEVAAIVADFEFNELGTYHSLIKHNQTGIQKLLQENPFWANRSDGLKKILKELGTGKPEAQVQTELIDFCKKHHQPNEPIYLAGNSIRVDRGFIDEWWPDFAKLLHYRMLDVSSFKIWWAGKGSEEFKKIEKHRALDDIRESIAELKHYASKINNYD